MTSRPTGNDPEAPAIARAAAMRQRLLSTVPLLTTDQVTRQLGISGAELRAQRSAGQLLAVVHEGQEWFPAFQFSNGMVHPGVRELLAALDSVPIRSEWVRLDFLTAPDAHDDGRSIADLLRDGELATALLVIRRYGETGA